MYIYVSHESPQDVFFDNVTIQHHRGPLLSEDHYYPFGLVQAGISSQTAGKLDNNRLFNKGSELQRKEFSDDSGLEWYTTQYRDLNPQLGRWNQVDPDIEDGHEDVSPYQSMADDPIRYNDPLGNVPCCETAEEILQWKVQTEAAANPDIGQPIIEVIGDIGAIGGLI